MTLTELRYVVALAQERHFGRAAQKCFVTQPTLSLALAKLEDELGVRLFERNKNEVLVTPMGAQIVEQARRVLDEVGKIQSLAKGSQDQLAGALRLGVIPTIGPYLLPELVPILRRSAPDMPLMIEENFTGNLVPMLRDGDIDAGDHRAALHGAGREDAERSTRSPSASWCRRGTRGRRRSACGPTSSPARTCWSSTPGTASASRCWRPARASPTRRNPEGRSGSSLETIRNMVASGLGVSVLPATALRAALREPAREGDPVRRPRAVAQGGPRLAHELLAAQGRGGGGRRDPRREAAAA